MPKSIRSPRQKRLLKMLIDLRRSHDLTQAEVATRLKKPQSFVAKYEGGERRLDVVEFLDVAAALGADPCTLLRELLRD